MDDGSLAGKIKEQEREIEFLRGEVGRLRAAIAQSAGSLEGMLKRRGFKVFRKEQGEGDVIRPPIGRKKLSDEFYSRLNKYSFRLFLRDVIKFQEGFTPGDLVRYSTLEVVNEYTAFLHRAGIVKKLSGGQYALKAKVKSFGPTLEWFVCELIRREYAAEAVWGASFKRTSAGGDYDLLKEGQEVEVRVETVDREKRKLSLSLAQVSRDEEEAAVGLTNYQKETSTEKVGSNLGDLLKEKLKE